MKVQVYTKTSRVKKIDKQTKKLTTTIFWYETNKSSAKKESNHDILLQTAEKLGYTSIEATIMAIMINEINNQDTVKRSSYMKKFSLKQGINIFFRKDMNQRVVK